MRYLIDVRMNIWRNANQTCELCGRVMERDHVMRCQGNKIYRNIRHNETVIGFVSAFRKDFSSQAICAQNNNVLKNNLQPDILIKHGGTVKYLDITYVASEHRLEEAFQLKNGRYGDVGVIIPVVIRYNGTIYDKSLELLKELKFDGRIWDKLYKHIYGAISRNWISAERSCRHKVDMMMLDQKMKYDFAIDKDEEFADPITKLEGYDNDVQGNRKDAEDKMKNQMEENHFEQSEFEFEEYIQQRVIE